MKIGILTLFPEMFEAILSAGVIGRATERGLLEFHVINTRDYSEDKHRKVDDYPFGGGAGLLLTAQPIFSALRSLGIEPHRQQAGLLRYARNDDGESAGLLLSGCAKDRYDDDEPVGLLRSTRNDDGVPDDVAGPVGRLLYLSPRGRLLDHGLAKELSRESALVLLCGHYEGVDQRVLEAYGFEEISIGDYVLTGGELPSMVLIDAVCRLVPGVLGSDESHAEESVYSGLLEYPQYTRPASFEGMDVPDILISGDHAKIALWNFEQSLRLTAERRPEMLRAWLAANYDSLDKKRKAVAAPYYEEFCN